MLDLYDLLLIKEQNNNHKLIYVQFEKRDYVFRMLSPKEYTQCKMLTTNKYELADAICQLTLIHPEDLSFSENPIGCISDRIADEIIHRSMIFRDLEVLVKFEEEQEKIDRFIPQCILFVKAAFSEFSLEEIEGWSYEYLMQMTAKAERILQLRGAKDVNGDPIKLNYSINEEKLNEKPQEPTVQELREQGIDPMFYFSDKIVLKKPLIDYPVILGSDWKNEELSKRVGEQILRR